MGGTVTSSASSHIKMTPPFSSIKMAPPFSSDTLTIHSAATLMSCTWHRLCHPSDHSNQTYDLPIIVLTIVWIDIPEKINLNILCLTGPTNHSCELHSRTRSERSTMLCGLHTVKNLVETNRGSS